MFFKKSEESTQDMGEMSQGQEKEPAVVDSPVTSAGQQESGDIIAFVGEEVTFKGTIRYQGTVRVDGRLEGEIYTDGNLIIGQKAVIAAKIHAGTIMCQGQLTGDVEAKHRVKLLSPAVFEGTITSPLLSMDEGVVFNGTCNMPQKLERKGKEAKLVISVEEAVKVK
ncbi:bactofilin family protein [Candidatus Nitrospira allomarina]|jgi:cytoskeletal protein CcmA (bactofilin family)|uniref:Polymer-forming cytoskeletal protein n=1 Tax=Candidatus Nitrospira allomarina TaxID=3020900 RepID=A0AA96GIC3_9BACT|nr:polymer-forming cytoskeletal protein [Candidatus Nitrospira allomarina]WNM58999.1 polymer-forming cytoskeletal protein [Candidatus Nitrospira allomarina]